jgi:DNA polymerase-3 subunit beta
VNLTIERGPALIALKRLADVVERKSTIPILGNIALLAEAGTLLLRATNLDMEASEAFPAEVTEEGALTLPADKLRDIVSNSDVGAQVSLAISESKLRMTVKSGRSRFNVAGLPAQDFPQFRAEGFVSTFVMPSKLLSDMVTRVAWSVAPWDSHAIGSVYLADVGDELHAVGTANTGIALRKELLPEGAKLKALLPPRLVAHLIRWLGDGDGEVSLSVTDSAYEDGPARLIRFERPGSILTSKLFDAPGFVDYAPIFPKARDHIATTDQDALKAAVRRVLVMSEDKGKPIILKFSEGCISILARGASAGEGEEEIVADYEGPEVHFSLSAGQITDALEVLKGDRVEIGFQAGAEDNEESKVTVSAPADPAFACFLMKLRG